MTRYDTQLPQVALLFAAQAKEDLRRHTEIIQSPMSDADNKSKAISGVFHELNKQKHGLRIDTPTLVDAVVATLPHLPYGSYREAKALTTIANHLNDLPPEKAVDAAHAAAHHTHFLGWYSTQHLAGRKPYETEQQTRRDMERTAVDNWATQMARLTPEAWDAKQKEFKPRTQAMSLLERTAQSLPKPTTPERPATSAQNQPHILAA